MTKVVVTKVTEQELAQIKSSAGQCGMTRSDFIRARALGYRPRRRLSEVEPGRSEAACSLQDGHDKLRQCPARLTDDEKVRLFRHRPTMLEWYEKVAAVTDRVTDFLQSAQSANNYPAGTTDRPDQGGRCMIAKAKAIAHGIRAMLYVSGESKNKKHPEKITRICDNFMPQGMDATGIWTEMKFAAMNHPNIKNNVIRMEISRPWSIPEILQSMTGSSCGKTLQRHSTGRLSATRTEKSYPARPMCRAASPPVWLHEESRSGIPHLHVIISRVDERGNINNDHAIHLRAQRAAEKVALQRGWTTAMHVHEDNIPKVSADCMEALRELSVWSWEGYRKRLADKGYKLFLRKDKKDVIRGYVLLKGSAKYKASELGIGRNLTASHIRQTWEKLHPGQDKQESRTSRCNTQTDLHTETETVRSQ